MVFVRYFLFFRMQLPRISGQRCLHMVTRWSRDGRDADSTDCQLFCSPPIYAHFSAAHFLPPHFLPSPFLSPLKSGSLATCSPSLTRCISTIYPPPFVLMGEGKLLALPTKLCLVALVYSNFAAKVRHFFDICKFFMFFCRFICIFHFFVVPLHNISGGDSLSG